MARKKLKNLNRIFQNRQDDMYRQKSTVDGIDDGGVKMNNLESNYKNQGTFGISQQQPIYFDELSLSKFIEEYLDYQIEYAYSELGKITDTRNELQHSGTASANLLSSSRRGSAKEEAKLTRLSGEGAASAAPASAQPKNALAAGFLQRVSAEGAAEALASQQVQHEQLARTASRQRRAGSSQIPIIHELIMLLEVDRLIFKTFNTLIAVQMRQDAKKIADFLQEQRNAEEMDRQFPQTQDWKEEVRTLELFMTYVKEALKFILFSFFKRCRLVITILLKHKDSRQDASNPLPRAAGTSSQKQTRESIIADMLAQNLKWAFLTILTCIEKSEEAYSQDKIELNANRHGGNDETGENQNAEEPPIMSDLVCFKDILMSLRDGLDNLSS